MQLEKISSPFYKNYLENSIAILAFLDSALPMAKPIVMFSIKLKQKHLAKGNTKYAKK